MANETKDIYWQGKIYQGVERPLARPMKVPEITSFYAKYSKSFAEVTGPHNFRDNQQLVLGKDYKFIYEYDDGFDWIYIDKFDYDRITLDKRTTAVAIQSSNRGEGERLHEAKYFAVEYAGFWHIQSGPYYGDTDILDAEQVGEDEAEKNAMLIAELLNNQNK